MKKIASLLVVATLLVSGLTAQEISWGGWLESKGTLSIKNGEELSDEDKKPKATLGATTAEYVLSVNGDNFGASVTLGTWLEPGKDTFAAPTFQNTYIWSNLGVDMIKLYAGLDMKVLDYSPAPAVGGGLYFNDAFGKGLGAYNHMGDGNYTKSVSGIITEVNVAGFSGALALRGPSAADAIYEDHIADSIIINTKYDAGIVKAYAGLSLKNKKFLEAARKSAADGWGAADYAEYLSWGGSPVLGGHGLWIAASTNIMEGLMADVKYETNIAEEAKEMVHNIALNLGYTLGLGRIATETNLAFMDNGGSSDAQSMTYSVGAKIVPFNVPVVSPSIDILIGGNNGKEAPVDYAFALNVAKEVGNVNNELRIGYSSNSGKKPVGDLKFQYAVSMWL